MKKRNRRILITLIVIAVFALVAYGGNRGLNWLDRRTEQRLAKEAEPTQQQTLVIVKDDNGTLYICYDGKANVLASGSYYITAANGGKLKVEKK